tara:strand:+ start:3422 stop:8458 length:5037 start_codon:yes stop_codon:yes gene_type:complete
MAKLDDYKNQEEIKNARGRARGARLKQKDIDVLPEPVKEETTFGTPDGLSGDQGDWVELHIHDTDNNLVESVYDEIDWRIENDELVLKPGDDLRRKGYKQGKFKVVYNFFSELLGGRLGHKVYIQEISSTRKEVRIVPVQKFPDATESGKKGPDVDQFHKGRAAYPKETGFEKRLAWLDKRIQKWNDYEEKRNSQRKLMPTWAEKRRKRRQRQLDFLQSKHDTFKKLHIDDRRFFEEFYKFTKGIDEDTYEYSKGKVFSPVVNSKFHILEMKGNGKFDRKLHKGAKLIVYNLSGKAIYETKIIHVYKNRRRIRVRDAYYVGGGKVKKALEPSLYKIKYKVSESVSKLDLKTLLAFGSNETSLVTNWIPDDRTYPEYPFSAIIRLYEPLPKKYKEKEQLWLVREEIEPVIETVNIIPKDLDQPVNFLRPPNYKVEEIRGLPDFSRQTQYESWNTLLSTNPTTQENIIDKLFGDELGSIELNTDYTDYSNFVNFGSAAERLKNFKYKLGLLQSYDSKLNELKTIKGIDSGSTADTTKGWRSGSLSEIEVYNERKRTLINGFDGYEKYLYYKDDTDVWGNYKTWPKSDTSSRPMVNYHTTSSQAETWFDNQLTSASLYDRDNLDNLEETVPSHIREDEHSDEYILFLNMIGQHFDGLWTYIKELSKTTNRIDNLEEGLPRDLTYHIGRSFGLNLKHGNDLRQLWRYALGTDSSGGYVTGSGAAVGERLSSDDITKEIWRRQLNNLPMLLKTRGTERSIKAMLTCYGIPSTILSIREYGGPVPDLTKPSYYVKDKIRYSLPFKGGQYVSSSWMDDTSTERKPDTLEFRFDTKKHSIAKADNTYTLVQGGHNWAINIEPTASGYSNKYGMVSFHLSGSGFPGGDTGSVLYSDSLPIYDGQFWSVMLNRTSTSDAQLTTDTSAQDIKYTLSVKKYDNCSKKILYKSINSIIIGGSSEDDSDESLNNAVSQSNTLYLGGLPNTHADYMHTSANQFSGSLQEFRLWTEVLKQDTFDNHVAAPTAFNGNEWNSAMKKLVLRYSFNQKKNHSLVGYYTESNGRTHRHSEVVDQTIDTTYVTNGHPYGFEDISGDATKHHYKWEVSEQSYQVPNIGGNRPVNKIRIENNSLVHGSLNTKKSVEGSSQDFAPIDSPKLGIYFSPVATIDEDIIKEMGPANLDDFYGAPIDQYKDSYTGLQQVRDFYFEKYGGKLNNFYDYIKLLDYYDRSIFQTLKELVPARSNTSVGLLIEPHLLERSKHRWKPIRTEEPNYDNKLDVEQYIELDGELPRPEGEVEPLRKPQGEKSNPEGEVETLRKPQAEKSNPEGKIDDPVDVEGEKSNPEGIVERPIDTLGEKSDPAGIIEDDVYKPSGKRTTEEGVIDTEDFNIGGINRRYTGEIDDEPAKPSGVNRRYTGEIDDEPAKASGINKRYTGEVTDEPAKASGINKRYTGEITDEPAKASGINKRYSGTMDDEPAKMSGAQKVYNGHIPSVSQKWIFLTHGQYPSAASCSVVADYQKIMNYDPPEVSSPYTQIGSGDVYSGKKDGGEISWNNQVTPKKTISYGGYVIKEVRFASSSEKISDNSKIQTGEQEKEYRNVPHGQAYASSSHPYITRCIADVNLNPSPSVTRLRYNGCKLESIDKAGNVLLFDQYGWDGKSVETVDGEPVVEVTYTAPTTLLVDGGGDLTVE